MAALQLDRLRLRRLSHQVLRDSRQPGRRGTPPRITKVGVSSRSKPSITAAAELVRINHRNARATLQDLDTPMINRTATSSAPCKSSPAGLPGMRRP
jgi:hypothetical protein